MGQSTWECLRILSSIMKVLALILLVSAVSAKNIRIQLLAPPTELEHGYCKGSPEPADLDKLSIDPFPIMIGNGLTETLELQVTLKEELAKGAQVHLDAKLEGIIPIPCVEINGLHIGSCDYDADHLLNLADPILCPDHFPEGQACALPLLPGVYVEGNLSSLDHWMIFLTPSFPSSRESSMLRLLLPPLLGTSWPVFGSELL